MNTPLINWAGRGASRSAALVGLAIALTAAGALPQLVTPAAAAPAPEPPTAAAAQDGNPRAAAQLTSTSSDTERPTVPGQPEVLEVTPTTVTITWAPSTDNVGVTSYLVYQGDQFYSQYVVRTVPNNDPVTLTLSPTAASTHFSVAARDAAGNTSAISPRTYVSQPPSFPRTGDETEPPTAPGAPVVTGFAPGGGLTLTWAPATDNVGVVEYHVYHSFNVDEVRVVAKVSTNSAVITPRGSFYESVWVVAYDAAWNSSRSPSVRLEPPAPPTPGPGVN